MNIKYSVKTTYQFGEYWQEYCGCRHITCNLGEAGCDDTEDENKDPDRKTGEAYKRLPNRVRESRLLQDKVNDICHHPQSEDSLLRVK